MNIGLEITRKERRQFEQAAHIVIQLHRQFAGDDKSVGQAFGKTLLFQHFQMGVLSQGAVIALALFKRRELTLCKLIARQKQVNAFAVRFPLKPGAGRFAGE